jgi:class 3 adenylate cyclase
MGDETPTDEPSRRTLAAIVFTDVAGFTSRMEDDEENTLQLVQKDLQFIRLTCERHGGRVLKTTGDGLLMHFESAVQAVRCALAAQETLGEMAARRPAGEVLSHRIGIHLGDVFLSADDVMGEGVNVAARLQHEAAPGGICISQTVYDVIKNRLQIQTTYLGPRELKHIKQAVPAYQIVLDAQAPTAATAGPGRSRSFRVAVALAGVALAAGVTIGILWLAGVIGDGASGGDTEPAGTTTRPADEPVAGSDAADPARIMKMRRLAMTTFSYERAVAWMEENRLTDTPTYARYKDIVRLKDWASEQMAGYTKDSPLLLRPARTGLTRPPLSESVKVWKDDAGVWVQGGDDAAPVILRRTKPILMLRIAAALQKAAPDSGETIDRALRSFAAECEELGLIPKRSARPPRRRLPR